MDNLSIQETISTIELSLRYIKKMRRCKPYSPCYGVISNIYETPKGDQGFSVKIKAEYVRLVPEYHIIKQYIDMKS